MATFSSMEDVLEACDLRHLTATLEAQEVDLGLLQGDILTVADLTEVMSAADAQQLLDVARGAAPPKSASKGDRSAAAPSEEGSTGAVIWFAKAATRNAADRQRCRPHLFFHRIGRPERVPGIWNGQEPTFRPERRSRPAKPTAPRRQPRRASTRVRASWTHHGLPGPSQLNLDAQSARNRRPGTAPAIWFGLAGLI